MQPNFTTDRLQLSLLSQQDRDFMFALVNSEGWLQFIGDRNVRSLDDADAYIKKIQEMPNLFYWVVRLKTNNTPLGIISFLKRGYLEHFDLGFAFMPQFSGQGYAYEASSEVLAYTKKDYAAIQATTVTGNVKSINLLKKLGFSFEREMEIEGNKLQIFKFSNF